MIEKFIKAEIHISFKTERVKLSTCRLKINEDKFYKCNQTNINT